MALTVGVNSYVTLAEAETYFEDRLDAAAWTDTTELQKTSALVTATGTLDSLKWDGYAVSETQSTAFPRVISYFDPRLGRFVNTSETPQRIKTATFELAYHLLNNDGLLDDTGTVTDLQIGPINLKEVRNASTIPAIVKRLIQPLLTNGGARSVWRAW